MTVVSAPPGTCILVLDRADRSHFLIPVVAFDVQGTIAYPIAVVAFGGLLKGVRALMVNGLITDRGFDIPFDSVDAWVQWAMSVTPGAESEGDEEVEAGTAGSTYETAPQMAARLRAENGTAGHTKVVQERPRKTFASKSFWSRTNMLGVLEVVEIEPGHGLPRDSEGFEKIKRDEFAAFKKQAKGGDDQVSVIAWDNGPVEEQVEQVEDEIEDDGFDSGLV